MSRQNVDLIRGIYDAFAAGDMPQVLAAMDPRIVWNEAESFPYADGNPYIGPDAVVQGVFARLGAEWESFKVVPEEFFDAGDAVLAVGRYQGAFKQTGAEIDAWFGHLWRLHDGKIASFRQFVDTLQVARAMDMA